MDQETDRERDKQTNRETKDKRDKKERQKDKETDRETKRQIEKACTTVGTTNCKYKSLVIIEMFKNTNSLTIVFILEKDDKHRNSLQCQVSIAFNIF